MSKEFKIIQRVDRQWFHVLFAMLLVLLAMVGLRQVDAAPEIKSAEQSNSQSLALFGGSYGAYGWGDLSTATDPTLDSPLSAAAITQKATLIMNAEERISSAVIDSAGGYAYFGTDTEPGMIVKVQLSDFTRVDVLTLNEGEDGLKSAVIDTANGYAYFGTDTTPGIVVKVRLSDFTRADAVTLDSGENELTSAVIDTTNSFAYFGTHTSPGRVVKVDVNPSNFARIQADTLNTGEDKLSTAVIDTTVGSAYFGTNTAPGIVVKINVNSATNFGRVTAVTLSDGSVTEKESRLNASIIDTGSKFAYFTTDSSSGLVVKINIDPNNFSRDDVLKTQTEELKSAVIDTESGKAYFGTNPDSGTQAQIVKVNLGIFTTEKTIGAGNASNLWVAIIDDNAEFAYFGTYEDQGRVFKVNVTVPPSPSDPPTFELAAAPLTFNSAARNFWAAVIDTAAGYAYFGGYDQPGTVAKIRLSTFSRVATLKLNAGDEGIRSAVIDTTNGFAYFGTATSPGRIVKVQLSDFTIVSTLTLESGENDLTSAVIDTASGFAYFGTDTSPGIVVKVRLSDFTRVDALTLDSGEDQLTSAVIDPANGLAYFGTYTGPGRVVKINLNAADFANDGRVTAITLAAGEDKLTSAVIDPTTSRAYFGTNTSPGRVVRIDVNPGNAFASAGTLELTINRLSSAVIDPSTAMAYFGSQQQSGRIEEVILSTFVRGDSLTLKNGENYLTSAVIDTTTGCAYFGAGDDEAGDFGSNYNPPGLSNRVMKIQAGACLDILPTTTTLTSDPNPSTSGQLVTFTAKVSAASGTPTGNVAFTLFGNPLGTVALNNGEATYSTSTLPPGEHTIVATYSGDADFTTSQAEVKQTVLASGDPTTTTLTSTPNPSSSGQLVIFTAKVSATSGTPTGNVVFTEGGNTLGTVALNNGEATFSTSTLTPGEHTIVATYSGDASFATSQAEVKQTVLASGDPTATTLTSTPNPSDPGELVVFIAKVTSTSGTPTGTVTFSENGTTLGSSTLNNGEATFATTTLSQGEHPIIATYGGDSTFGGSVSNEVKQVVGTAVTTNQVYFPVILGSPNK